MNNTIHVKLEYDQALQAKKDLLSLEVGLIRTAKRIRNYQLLRTNELKLKTKLKNSIGESKGDIKKIETLWPRGHFPELDRFEEKIGHGFSEVKKEAVHNADLEIQLKEIQNKLKSLS